MAGASQATHTIPRYVLVGVPISLFSPAFLLLPGTHHRERDEEEWPSGYPGVISSTMREGGVEEGISRVPDLPHPPMPSIVYPCEMILRIIQDETENYSLRVINEGRTKLYIE